MKIKIKRLNDSAVIPKYSHIGDMGMDITATSLDFDTENDCYTYHTGLSFQIPENHGMLIFPRSSNRKTDCYLANHVGVLDSCYTGELLFCFKHRDKKELNDYNKPYNIGDRIGQIVILPYPYIEFIEVNELDNTERGDNGFGSTGN